MLASLVTVLVGSSIAHGITIPLVPRDLFIPDADSARTLTGADPFGFVNLVDSLYGGIVQVSGESFLVQLDTGSSDIWLDTSKSNISRFVDTGVNATLRYVDLTVAAGSIVTSDFTFGNFTIANQAWINAPGANATKGITQGILGLGPPSLAAIPQHLKDGNSTADGSTFLDRLFSEKPDEPNFMTFRLSRNGFGVIDGGEFTIGDILTNHSAITSTPRLLVQSPDRWATYMDALIINGKKYTNTTVQDKNLQLPWLSIVDTGASPITAPVSIVDAMFGHLPGAQKGPDGIYSLPCDSKVNITVVFGENEFPIHPVDLLVPVNVTDEGEFICQGRATTLTVTPEQAGGTFLLGDVFQRNIYALYDFGSWATVGDTPPFMQFLSLTDRDQAWAEFDNLTKARNEQFLQAATSDDDSTDDDSTDDDSTDDDSSTADASSPAGAISDDDDKHSDVSLSDLTRNSYIIMGLLATVIVVLLVLLTLVISSNKSAKRSKVYAPVAFKEPPSEGKPLSLGASRYSAEYSTPYSDDGH
ncbi:acid protease [Panus rudis PR-1116 ss-1]|nr:acid protease [Panus rudis PR-1116 ss-1]